MLALKLALRGLWRHKLRTFITVGAIAFGHFMMLVFIALGDGVHEQMIDLGVRQGAGHVVVQAKGFQKMRSVELLVTNPERVRKTIRGRTKNAKVVARAYGGGMAKTSNDTVGMIFIGVEPAGEREVSDIPKRIVRGVYLGAGEKEIARAERKVAKQKKAAAKRRVAAAEKKEAGPRSKGRSGSPSPGIRKAVGGGVATSPEKPLWCARKQGAGIRSGQAVIGVQMARTLKVKLCDKVVVQARGLAEQESRQFRVVGVFKTGNSELDGYLAHLPLGAVQKLLHIGRGVHQIAVFLPSAKQTDRVAKVLAGALAAGDALEVLPWNEALPQLAGYVAVDAGGNYVFLFIVFFIIMIGVLNTVLMSVMERTREFGLMRALGAGPWKVGQIVLSEAALIGLIGVTLGILGAWPLNDYLVNTGLDLNDLFGESVSGGGVTMSGMIHSKVYLASVVWGSILVFGLAVLSAVYPAIRAMRLHVLKAIHHA